MRSKPPLPRLFLLGLALAWALAAPAPAPAKARADAPSCADERLSELALEVLGLGALAGSVELDELARDAGSNAVALRLVRAAPSSPEFAELVADASAREGAALVCGEAESGDVLVRIVGRQGARLGATLGDAGLVLDVVLVDALVAARGAALPRLVVRADDGTSTTRDLSARETRVVLPPGFPGRFVAQVVATDASGPRPVAELRFGPRAPRSSTTASASAEDAETHVARVRRLAGVASLRPNHLLDGVATAHAAAICEAGRAAHDLGGAGPVERLRRAGVEARAVGEVVARAASRAEGLVSLDESPSHRLALEDEHYTDAGYGESTAPDGHVCTVVVLAAWPRFAGR